MLAALCAATCTAGVTSAQQHERDATLSESSKVEAQDEPQHFEPFHSRWYAPGYTPAWLDLTGYEVNERGGRWWDPYHQNRLKGDFPILGTEDVFFAFTGTFRQTIAQSTLPIPTGGTASGGLDFFGNGRVRNLVSQIALSFDLFKEPQSFRPVDWRIKVTPVFQRSDVSANEPGVLFASPGFGRHRGDDDFALQEALVEYHIADLSHSYDFLSAEAGILPFRSDFRGFVFDDTNLGARISGNADKNRWQYNLVAFDMLDKDTNSGLNEFQSRDQHVLIANLYRQDWPVQGFTAQASVHYNHDFRGFEFDDNGGLVTPAPIGLARENHVESYYLGLAGEGHFGRVNVTTAFYQAKGHDTLNPLAGREVQINAQLAALEVSYDFDWLRVRGFGLYASGDGEPRDDRGEGFAGILDAPAFAGGSLSYLNSQGIRLLGVDLSNAGSPLPDLQSSQTQGHTNFVNPGLVILGGALEAELTPKWRAQIGASYLRFQRTESLELYLELPEVDREIGAEVFAGAQYRPFLNNHVVVTFGASTLFPGAGFERIYQSDDTLYTAFTNLILTF